jgi:hypothetical protein
VCESKEEEEVQIRDQEGVEAYRRSMSSSVSSGSAVGSVIGRPGGYELGFWVGRERQRGGFYRHGVLNEGQRN